MLTTSMSSAPRLPLSTIPSTRIDNRYPLYNQPSFLANSPPQIQQWDCEDSISSHVVPKARTIRYRLSQLCREGQPHLARQLFDTIPRPTTVLWNAIIIGFICNNMPAEAILIYSRMKSSYPDTKCDPYTYSSTLKACAETRQLQVGKAVHCHILHSHSYPSRIVCNSLLNMYASCLSSADNDMASFKMDYTRCDLVRRVFDSFKRRNVVAWNTLILWYAKTERFVEAVKSFAMMMKMGIKPTIVSFVNVFRAVSGMGEIGIANALYGLLLKLGTDYSNDLFALSSAIFMFSELSCLDFARIVFDQSLERNTEVWNTMISGYVQNNCPSEALDLFVKFLESQKEAVLDDVTFLSALTAASQLQHLDFARQLHALISKNSLISQVMVLNATIVMYSRCNCVQMSFDIFSRMQERDVVSWNTLISSFVQNGLDDKSLMLVYEMQNQGFLLDSVTVAALLSAASNLRNLEIGKQTHAYLLRHGIHFEGLESYLIDMYAKSGLIKAAQGLFDKNCISDDDPVTWNAIIAGNTQNGLTEQAFIVFRQMLLKDVSPNAVTLASILPACNPIGNIALGKQLHAFAIRQSLDHNVFVVSALVDMYSKSGSIKYAENVFAKSPVKNSVTHTNMILGYGQHGMGRKALTLFNSMRGFGIEPDAITFVAVLSACSYSGLVNEGLKIFQSMQSEYGIVPSSEHFCCIVDLLGRDGRVVEAYDFVKQLGEGRNRLRIWGALLAACRIHREFSLGKIVAQKLLQMEGGDSITGYQVLLSNIYAEEEKWEHVKYLRRGMQDKNLTKELGCSWIDIAGYVNCFTSRDRNHHQCDELYEILDELAVQMRDAGYRPFLDLHTDWMFEE